MDNHLSINDMRDLIHRTAVDKGWWDEGDRNFGEIIALVHSELSEALEEYRDGHAVNEVYYKEVQPRLNAKPEGVPIELADVIIRILDFCGAADINIQSAIFDKLEYNTTRSYKHGGKVI